MVLAPLYLVEEQDVTSYLLACRAVVCLASGVTTPPWAGREVAVSRGAGAPHGGHDESYTLHMET